MQKKARANFHPGAFPHSPSGNYEFGPGAPAWLGSAAGTAVPDATRMPLSLHATTGSDADHERQEHSRISPASHRAFPKRDSGIWTDGRGEKSSKKQREIAVIQSKFEIWIICANEGTTATSNSHSHFDMGILFRLSKFGNPPKPASLANVRKHPSPVLRTANDQKHRELPAGNIECREVPARALTDWV